MKPINTCVIGLGLGGLTFHCSFTLALDSFNLYAVVERNPVNPGGRVKKRYGASVKIYNTVEQALDDTDIELVIVSTPNNTHFQIVKAALEAGKHVLVDKPVTTTVREAQELGDIAEAKGLVLYAFQNRRWDSDFLALRKLLELPADSPHSLGHLVEFESHYDRYRTSAYGSWKDEVGASLIYNLGSHIIDQALVLFGRPQKLTAFLQNVRKMGTPDYDDSFTIYMQYSPNSARPYPFTVILRAHTLSVRSPQLRFVLRGTNGSYTKFGIDIQEDQLKAMPNVSDIFSAEYGREPREIWGTVASIGPDGVSVTESTWPSTDAGCYGELFRNLGEAIRNGAEQAVTWKEATSVIEIIELAMKSSREGITVSL